MNTEAITTSQVSLTQTQEAKINKVAKEFEALLLSQLTSVMAKTAGPQSVYGSDAGSELAQQMFSEQLAIAMAEGGGIGIAETLKKRIGMDAIGKLKALAEKPESIEVEKTAVELVPKKTLRQETSLQPTQDLVFRVEKENQVKNADTGSIGIVSRDSDSVDDKVWRAPFDDATKGIDFTKKENQVPMNVNPVSKNAPISYSMPVEGRISSRYGMRFHPIDRRNKFHGGLDIAAGTGTPIKASGDGKVIFAGRRGGYGNVVEIEHRDGRVSRYAHANTLNVKVGAEVKAGQQIATVGSTGKATGPHLHFEIRENGKPVNPAKLIN